MHNQTAIQYWGAGLSVIPLAASDYRSPQVAGHRTRPPSKPQAPNQRGGAPTESDKSDRSDTAPHQTLWQNQTAIQYWGLGLSVIPLAASDYRLPQVPGNRTNPASKTASPQSRRAAHQLSPTSLTGPTLRRTRHSGKIRPLYSTGGSGNQSYLWLRVVTVRSEVLRAKKRTSQTSANR